MIHVLMKQSMLSHQLMNGALLLGHRRKEIIQSVSKQLSKGTLYCTPTETEIELSKLI